MKVRPKVGRLLKSMFNELPSQARKFFKNDPAVFLDHVYDLDPEDEKAMSRLVELGLAEAPQGAALGTLPGNEPDAGSPASKAASEDAAKPDSDDS